VTVNPATTAVVLVRIDAAANDERAFNAAAVLAGALALITGLIVYRRRTRQ